MMHTLLLFDDFFQYNVPDVAYMVGINIQQLPKNALGVTSKVDWMLTSTYWLEWPWCGLNSWLDITVQLFAI